MVKLGQREVPMTDAVLMGTGALMLIDGFLPWYGIDLGPISVHTKGLSSGLFAWLPILLVIAVGVVVALRVFTGQLLPATGSVGPAALLLLVSGLATVLLVLKLLADNSYTEFGIYLGIVLAAVQAAYAWFAFKASGEPLPTFGRGAASS